MPDMDLEPVKDTTMQKRLTAGFNRYLDRNERFLKEKRLIPDSLYHAYTK